MKGQFQQFNRQVQQRQREMGYSWMKERQRAAKKGNQDLSQYPPKKSGGFANIIWILAVGIIIYFLFFSH